MAGILSRFRIEALHQTRTIDVKIADNKLVLVGENGTGKSTVANFIYFLPLNLSQCVVTQSDQST
jgi:ABC-type uncharacterized transport system ATPase subunit